MAKDKRSQLSDAVKSLEEKLLGDNRESKAEREFERIVEKAFKEGRIPSECIEYIPVSEDMAAKVVIYKEV